MSYVNLTIVPEGPSLGEAFGADFPDELPEGPLSTWDEPQLEDAVVAMGRSSHGIPFSISRVVNLEGVEDPVLSLDLLWWRGDTTVLIGVQGGVGEELDLVSRIEPEDGNPRTWTNRQVSLESHRDKVVRLIIFTNETGYKDVIIGKVRGE